MSHGVLPHAVGSGHPSEHAEQNLLEKAGHKLGIVLPLGYALLSAVGIAFETLLLREFHTDFLTYAEPEDFLMAGLRHPVVLAFVALSVGIMAAMYSVVRFGSSVSKRYAAWRDRAGSFVAIRFARQVAPFAAVAYYFFAFTQFYAGHHAKAIRSGEEPLVRLQFLQFGTDSSSPPQTEGYVVATTGRYVFLWAPDTHQMQVIPTSAVRRLLMSASASKAEEAKEASPTWAPQ
jgi:hypothetical protein